VSSKKLISENKVVINSKLISNNHAIHPKQVLQYSPSHSQADTKRTLQGFSLCDQTDNQSPFIQNTNLS
jgi:hypothetical protein